jgi:hypothetical protein
MSPLADIGEVIELVAGFSGVPGLGPGIELGTHSAQTKLGFGHTHTIVSYM